MVVVAIALVGKGHRYSYRRPHHTNTVGSVGPATGHHSQSANDLLFSIFVFATAPAIPNENCKSYRSRKRKVIETKKICIGFQNKSYNFYLILLMALLLNCDGARGRQRSEREREKLYIGSYRSLQLLYCIYILTPPEYIFT